MKKIYLLLLLCAMSIPGFSQVVAISPTGDGGFESGTTLAANGWTGVNTSASIGWYLGTVPTGYSGARCSYFSISSGTANDYNPSAAATSHFYRDITIPVGATSINLSFLLKGSGETGYDRLLVYTAPTTVTPAAGVPASSTTALAGATLVYTQAAFYATYTSQSITLPNTLAGTTVRLIFTWQNDGVIGTLPAAAVDNISFTYIPPPPTITAAPTTLSFGGVTVGTPSPAQVANIAGTFLSPAAGTYTVTAPANYEVSSDGTTWFSSYTTAYTGSGFTSVPVYIRLTPTAATTYCGNVTIAGGTATTNIAVCGTGSTACSGTPTPGTAAISPASGLATTPFTLSLTGTTVAGGLTYQWQSSTSATGPFTNISGATTTTFGFTGISSNMYYQAVVTCPTFTPAQSNTVMATFLPTPACTTTAASWTSVGSFTYGVATFSVTAATGPNLLDNTIMASLNTATAYLSRTATIAPITLYKGNFYPSSISYGTASTYQEAQVWIDFNNDGVFSISEEVTGVIGLGLLTTTINPVNFNITIPLSAPTGVHLMRVRGIWESIATTLGVYPARLDPCLLNFASSNPNYFSGTCVDYYVDIQTAPPCVGTPTAGIINATVSNGCTPYTSNLTLVGASSSSGLLFQWSSSADDITYAPITGATSNTYAASVTANIYYKCTITCVASGLSATTPSKYLTLLPVSYASIPFFESFEPSWINACAIADAPNNFWRNTTTSVSVNNFWRRQDDPQAANTGAWVNPTLGQFAPVSSDGSYSARWHSYQASSGTTGDLNLYINLPVGTKQISYDYINTSGTDVITCRISIDGGATWTTVDAPPAVASIWTNRTFTTTLASPTAIVRFQTTGDFGVTDIGLDNVNIYELLPCVTPTNQPTVLNLTPGLFNVNGSFTASSPAANKYMVIMTTTSTAPTAPTDGINYAVGSTVLGGTVVANSNYTTYNATGLTPGTQYWFWVYAYNSLCTGGPLYATGAPLTNTVLTTSCSLTGIKTVGPTGDYPTITAALTAVNTFGLAGPLAIELQTTYDGTGETYPIVISTPPCASATNTLTIRPQGTLTVTYGTAAQPFFDLNGARYVIIDGRVGSTGTTKALTIINTNTGGQAIRFVNDASNNIVRYCNVKSVNTSTVQGTIFFFTTTGLTGNDNNIIDNCDISDGATTPYNAIYSTGTTGKENSGNVISNCNISNFFAATTTSNGIFLSTANTDWTITGNRLFQTAARTYTTGTAHRGIIISNTVGNNFVVTNNTVGYASAAGTGTYTMNGAVATSFQAIYLSVGNAIPSSVQGNIVTGFNFTTTSTASTVGGAFTGINIIFGSVNVGNITPNIIGATSGNGAITATINTNTGGTVVGINASASNPAAINIQNNIIGSITVNNGTTTLGGGIQGIQISSTGSYSVTGNTIGSTTTANSFSMPTVTTGAQFIYGINSATTTANIVQPIISNNIVANHTALGNATTSASAGIINTSNASATITGNTIYNISSATTNTVATGQTGVMGIGYYGNTLPLATITNNTIYSIINTNTTAIGTTVCGIGTTNAVGPMIAGNKIYDLRNANTGTTATAPPRAVGVLVGTPTTTGATVVNNMISLGNALTTNTSFTGIMNAATGTLPMNVYFNTVNIEGTATTGANPSACMIRGNYSATAFTTPMDVRNNIFNNVRTGGTGKHYAIANTVGGTASATGWGSNASNYNILNGNAATIGFWSGDKTFATWKTSSLSDNNSYTASAVTFVNAAAGDLHINMGVIANNVESHGIAIAGYNTDFDNQTRPGPTSVNGGGFAPDLGADEFDGNPLSNLPPTITYTTLTNACGTGDRTFTATIADGDLIPISGTLQPRVYFKKGAAGTWFSTQGTLTAGTAANGTWSFTISSSLMGGLALNDQIFYYVIAQDGATQISSNPSAGMVATDVNTVTTPPTTPNSYNVLLSLSGTIPVGAASAAPFNTITSAVNAYNTGCISGPVVFSLTDATYPTETFPITVQLNPFASVTNTLTIQPAPGVAVNINGLAASPAIFKFLNAKYVTLDGLNTGGSSLSLNNNNTGTSATVWFASTNLVGPGNKFVTVRNTNIVGGTNISGATSSWGFLSAIDGATPTTTSGMDNDNITIQNNNVTRVAYGIYAFGTAYSSTGGLDNWLITGNKFGPDVNDVTTNISYNGMYMGSMMNPVVTNNTVQNVGLPTLASQVVGIFFTGLVNGAVVSQNTINGLVSNQCSSSTGANFGIGFGSVNTIQNCTITRNVIYNISNIYNAASCGRSVGIMINTSNGASNTLIANNMISDIRCMSGASVIYMPAGIDIVGTSGGVKVYYNTINMNSAVAGNNAATFSSCIYISNGTGSGLDIRNNIFRNSYDNTTVSSDLNYSIYSAVGSSNYSNINYNNYSVAGTNPLAFIFSNQFTLANIQSGLGGDANSMVLAPQFISGTNLRLLAFAGNLPLIAGTPAVNATVGNDIDGTTRSGTNPVIGAHEVVIVNCTGSVAGTAAPAIPVFCGSGVTTINTAGTTQGLGVSYQWQSSTDSAAWTNISGATSLSYTIPTAISNTTWYRMKVGCSFSATSDSVTTKVVINPFPAPITGPNKLCINSTYTLASATPSGIWSSSNPVVGTISPTGVVTTGAGGGNTIISYTLSTGCRVTSNVTVNSVLPVVSINPTPGTVCEGGTSLLSSTSTNPGATVYTIDNITFAPVTFTATGTFSSATTPTTGSNDDGNYSVPLPFAFEFYGTTYAAGTSMFIGTNGYVSFVSGMTTTSIGTMPNVSFPATMSIFGRDMNLNTGGNITYGTTGTAPNRKFVVSYNSVPDFSTGLIENGQIVLSEATGNIEYHITAAAASTHSIGIQAAAGSASAIVPGQNFSTTPLTNTAYRFVKPSPVYTWVADTSLSATNILSPTASPVNATTTYTLTVTASNGCVASANATVTTNPVPASIGGTLQVCAGLTTTLSNTATGGTWQSSNTAIATVGSTTGVVTGVTAGTVTMTYAFTAGLGCYRTAVVTVNPLPTAIAGTNEVCIASTTTLTDVDGGGTWQSANTSIATIGSADGIVTGVVAGTTKVTYTLPTGCIIDRVVTVYPVPSITVTPTTPTTFCIGDSTNAYSIAATMPVATLLSQNFNGTLAGWTIETPVGSSVGAWQIVASGFDGSSGDGTPMLQASAMMEGNQVISRVVSPSFATIGYDSAKISFNQYFLSDASDQVLAVEYSVNNGPWDTVYSFLGMATDGGSTWAADTPQVILSLPSDAINQPNVRLRWHYNGALYGWFLDNIKVKGTLPPATYTWTGGSDLSCTTCTTPMITPAASGTNIYTVSAVSAVGCTTSGNVTVNVNPLPSVIGGSLEVCEAASTTLTNADAAGTWTSSNTSVAVIGSSTGLLGGIVAGTSIITYTLPTGCIRSTVITVNPLPAVITGTMDVCEGLTTTLADVTAAGTWSSSNTAIADVNASGVVTGIAAGNATVSYTISATGCYRTANMTVNPLPATIAGTPVVCEGLTTSLSNTSTGGTWMSGNISIATIGSSTGILTGVLAGNAMITYTLPTGCIITTEATVNALPADITGTMDVCEGLTTAMGETTTGGTWTSSNTAVADVDAAGIVTGIAAGNATVTYTITATGCIKTTVITVNPLPATITGIHEVCEGLTTTLANTSTGGTWMSDNTSVATIGSASGVVTGVVAGTANITYTLPTGCIMPTQVTVNALPDVITGTMAVCEGLNTTLSETTTGGTWTSSNTTVATVDAFGVVSALVAGNTTITYTITATGCIRTADVTVNPLPAVIGGTQAVCEGLTTTLTNATSGGTWTSTDNSIATIGATSGIASGVSAGNTNITFTITSTGCIRTTELTVNATPAAISGTPVVCESLTTTLSDATPSGTWSSSNTTMATVDASGIVSGLAAGNPIITYMLPTGCISTVVATVNPLPAIITGTMNVCEGLTTTLADATPLGIWISDNTSVATVTASSGLVTGIAAGSANITYALSTGCLRTTNMIVNPLPATIGGASEVCATSSITLTNGTAGGTWSSSNPTVATIGASSGILNGVVAGSAIITYQLATGCIKTHAMTVNALPIVYNVTGGGSYCFSGAGVNVGMANSELTNTYRLYNGSTLMATAAGTGSTVSFGSMTVAGVYTVVATTTPGCNSNMSGSATVVIIPLVTPVVTLGSTPDDTVCAGTSVTFSATPINGGTTPAYEWKVNGTTVSTITAAHTYVPVNGDVITVTMTSSEACPSPATATAAQTMIVVSNETPVVTVNVGPNDTLCQGSTAVYTATSLFGGNAPIYTWYKNSVATGATGSIYSYVPVNGDVIMARLNSNYLCPIVNNVASNNVNMKIDSVFVPVVDISANPGLYITYGTPVTFTSSVTEGGPKPTYQWYVNSVAVNGATSNVYTNSTLNNNDSVACLVWGTGMCSYFTFNAVKMVVSSGVDVVIGQSDIRMMPNPTEGEFVVNGTLATRNNAEVNLEVIDMLGQVVFKGTTIAKAGQLNERVKLSNSLANGMYMLNVRSGGELKVFHFVLKQ